MSLIYVTESDKMPTDLAVKSVRRKSVSVEKVEADCARVCTVVYKVGVQFLESLL